MGKKVCICGKDGSKLCGKCGKVGYCGRDCQTKDWKFHKLVCRQRPPTDAAFEAKYVFADIEDSNMWVWSSISPSSDGVVRLGNVIMFKVVVKNAQKNPIKVTGDTFFFDVGRI
eukprot:TRINITY_DN629_c0_g1_i1.p2 TRINITY_DN629_c0_g1~~TRINITY_DN629_c0_g1_i1.p2  ORF type:complete len:114 (-),score=18.86 TRINITY_DN629_c0_g1_i1:332-673(-)